MQSCSKAAILSVFVGFIAVSANAALIAYEGFDYAADPNGLNSANGGVGWNTDWNLGNSAIILGGFNYTDSFGNQLVTIGNRAATDENNAGNFRSFPILRSTGTVYFSFLLRNINAASPSNYAGFSLFSGPSERIFFGETNFYNGPLGHEQIGTTVTQFPGTNAGLLNLVVVKLEFNAGTISGNEKATIFINPALANEPTSTPYVLNNLTNFAFDTIRIQSGRTGGSSPLEICEIDEIRFGDTYADVTPHVIPEPHGFGFNALGFLTMLSLWRKRLREKTAIQQFRRTSGR
jgi:hypothetical protein